MRLLCFAWPEDGHLIPMLDLAASARGLGFEVQVAGILDIEPHVRAAGFEFLPLCPDIFPKGTMAAAKHVHTWRGAHALVRVARQFMSALTEGRLTPLLRRAAPSLCLADVMLYYLTFPAWAEGIACAVVHTSFPPGHREGLPPFSSALRPSDDRTFAMRVRLANGYQWLRLVAKQELLRCVGLRVSLASWTRRVAASSGYPVVKVWSDLHVLEMCPEMPQIVLAPQELDFPRPARPNRYHVGPLADSRSRLPDFPWGDLDPEKRIVYCSLGSQAHLYGRVGVRLIEAVADGVTRQPDLQVLIAAGDLWDRVPASVKARAHVVRTAPQPAILERAHVFITHGGLGSVKESVMAGVPMIVYPMVRDQFGNAARVHYHGLGLAASKKGISGHHVAALLTHVITDPRYRATARRFQAALRQRQAAGAGLDILARLASPDSSGRIPVNPAPEERARVSRGSVRS